MVSIGSGGGSWNVASLCARSFMGSWILGKLRLIKMMLLLIVSWWWWRVIVVLVLHRLLIDCNISMGWWSLLELLHRIATMHWLIRCILVRLRAIVVVIIISIRILSHWFLLLLNRTLVIKLLLLLLVLTSNITTWWVMTH